MKCVFVLSVVRCVMKYSRECLSCFNMIHHERHDVYFRYNKKKEEGRLTVKFSKYFFNIFIPIRMNFLRFFCHQFTVDKKIEKNYE